MHAVMGTGRLIAGRYRLQGPIGRGAMGIVWRGRDELLARDVAAKEVQITAHASPADAEVIYQRTLREARTAARLAHPSVVTVFDVVEENGSPWIIMELVKARSLDRVITEDGPLRPLEAAELGASLVSALASAHSAGVLHRDVKPSNVLVTEDGKAVLTDFGIATFAGDPSMTLGGMVVGTPGFTAPERVRGDVATPASDLWSLGATLYAAVEGRGPFDRVGGSTVITAGVATEDAPRAPSAGPLGPVIDALLSRDPGTRPDTATAARLLSEAATAARTGARPLGEGWLAAEASSAVRDAAARDAAVRDAALGDAAVPDAAAEVAGVRVATVQSGGSADADTVAGLTGAGLAGAGLTGAGLVGAGLTGARFGPSADQDAIARSDAAEPGAGEDANGSVQPSEPRPVGQHASDKRAAFLDPPVFVELSMPDLTGPGDVLDAQASSLGSGDLPHGLTGGIPEAALGTGFPSADQAGSAGSASGAVGGGTQPGPGSDTGPVLWQPLKPASGEAEGGTPGGRAGRSGASAGPGPGGTGGPGSGDGGLRFWRRNGPSKPSSGRWRLMVAGVGIAAIVIAAVIGWGIYNHTLSPEAALGPPSTGISAAGATNSAKPGASGAAGSAGKHRGHPAAGQSGPTTASHLHSPGTGNPSARPSGKASSPGSSPSPKPSATASPSPSPTPSPTASPPVLPSGWVWHQFAAAVMGSAAGFKIGLPSLWTQSVARLVAEFSQPAKGFHLNVNLGQWTYVKPLAEAQELQSKYAATYSGYKELTLSAVGFQAIGGFRAAPAAELKYSWHKPSGGTFTELVVLVTLATKSGAQPYAFHLWASSPTFGTANGVFHTALKTFRPLPA